MERGPGCSDNGGEVRRRELGIDDSNGGRQGVHAREEKRQHPFIGDEQCVGRSRLASKQGGKEDGAPTTVGHVRHRRWAARAGAGHRCALWTSCGGARVPRRSGRGPTWGRTRTPRRLGRHAGVRRRGTTSPSLFNLASFDDSNNKNPNTSSISPHMKLVEEL